MSLQPLSIGNEIDIPASYIQKWRKTAELIRRVLLVPVCILQKLTSGTPVPYVLSGNLEEFSGCTQDFHLESRRDSCFLYEIALTYPDAKPFGHLYLLDHSSRTFTEKEKAFCEHFRELFDADLKILLQEQYHIQNSRKWQARFSQTYDALIESFPQPITTYQFVEKDFILIAYNKAEYTASKGKIKSLFGKPARQIFEKEEERKILNAMCQAFRQRSSVNLEAVHPDESTGMERHFVYTFLYLPEEYLLVYREDHTSLKLAEQSLRESKDQYMTQFNSVPLPVLTIEKKPEGFVIVGGNQAALEYPHVILEQVLGVSIEICWKDDAQLIEFVELAYEQKKSVSTQQPYTFKTTGKSRYLAMVFRFVPPNFVLLYAEDITEKKQAELALKESEKKFKNIFNMSVDSIFITDASGYFLDMNTTGFRKTGLSKEEMKQKRISELVDLDIEALSYSLETVDNLCKNEISYTNREGQKVVEEIYSQCVDYEGQDAILHISRDITQRKLLEQKILRTIIQTEEQERSRMAQELHDGLGPLLSTSKLYTKALHMARDGEEQQFVIHKIEETLEEAILSIQEISNNLSPHVLRNFGLPTAIRTFYAKLQYTSEITFELNTNLNHRIDEDIETTLYRVAVELIHNSLKHARAQTIVIDLNVYKKQLHFSFSDDGQGFDLERTLRNNTGMGLTNIFNRIKSLNGTIDMKSKKCVGTNVFITINFG
ncbi:PAS domain S-box protein [Rapidithrix thailandica]|uniref:histidine kinase n=1 Tax=Rapidithrix thailandica TaxID=413964 RepID=A0AAW9SIV7_9BACT